MKALTLIAVLMLSGCASYADLQSQCDAGSANACRDLASRNSWESTIGDGLMAQQEQQERALSGGYAPAPDFTRTQPVTLPNMQPQSPQRVIIVNE